MDGQRQRLLLIEEDPILREVTGFRLDLLGYDLQEFDNAEAALDFLANTLPDVIIVGYTLPGIDGIELIDRLSNDVRTSMIPVMLLSPHSDLDDVKRAYNAGADEYLVTPYDPIVLEHKVARLASAAVPQPGA